MQGGGDVPIVVMTLPLLLSAVSVDFLTGGPVIDFTKTCCMIVPCLGSALDCGAWLIDGYRWRTFDPEHSHLCMSSW